MVRVTVSALALLTAALGGGALAAPGVDATASCTSMKGVSAAGTLRVLNPQALPGASEGKIDLPSIIATGGLDAYTAQGIVRDGTSAAILLYETTTSAPVCFDAANFTFEPYSAKFLTSVSTKTTIGTYQVPASQLISVAGHYYAATLLRAPDDRTIGDSADITAGQCCWTGAKAALQVYRPPVLFIHGLWGDSTSLAEPKAAILSAYKLGATKATAAIYAKTILALQYQAARAFDSPVVTNVVLDTADAALAVLAKDGIVGGRVDIVAHSMGGLVTRSTSARSTYRGPTNRGLGQFHDIVTIDTPETGSGLANYLINSASATLQAPPFSLPWNLWVGAGCGLDDTVETCLPNLGMPLTESGQSLEAGAVWSLQPGSTNLVHAPASNIPDANWRPVSAYWPANANPTSFLRNSLNALIKALYQTSTAAPTSAEILGYEPNDAIVTEPSQVALGVSPGVILNLAHTAAPTEAMILGIPGDNSNVLQSPLVDSFVLCRLTALTVSSCESTATNTLAVPNAVSDAADSWTPRYLDASRATIAVPANATYGLPITVAVTISGGAALHRIVTVSDHPGDMSQGPVRIEGTRASVTITPRITGPLHLAVGVQFVDGGVSTARETIAVAPPAAAPVAFHANGNGGNSFVILRAGEERALRPTAIFADSEDEIPLGVGVTYQVTAGDGQALSVTRDGQVTALHPGHATVTGRFGSALATLDVIVKPQD